MRNTITGQNDHIRQCSRFRHCLIKERKLLGFTYNIIEYFYFSLFKVSIDSNKLLKSMPTTVFKVTDENGFVYRHALSKKITKFIQTLSCEGFQCRTLSVGLFSSVFSSPPNPCRLLEALDGIPDTN